MIARVEARAMSQSSPCWHALPPDEVLRELVSSSDGLSEPEWRRRLAHYGPNRFRRTPPASVRGGSWSPRSGMWWSGCWSPAPRRAADRRRARRRRDRCGAPAQRGDRIHDRAACPPRDGGPGRPRSDAGTRAAGGPWREVDARDLVPGDVIHLEAGQTVPADARLLDASELRVVEASLTGEPVPAEKRADVGLAADVPLPDRVTMVYKATTVAAGGARRRWWRQGWPRRWVGSGRSPARWRIAPRRSSGSPRRSRPAARRCWRSMVAAARRAARAMDAGLPPRS